MTFDETAALFASYTVRPDGTGTAVFVLDGHEITESEYWASQAAAVDRAVEPAARRVDCWSGM